MNDNEQPDVTNAFLLELLGSLVAKLIETGSLTREDAIDLELRAIAATATEPVA